MQDFQLISQFKTIQENGKTMQGNALNYEVNRENRNYRQTHNTSNTDTWMWFWGCIRWQPSSSVVATEWQKPHWSREPFLWSCYKSCPEQLNRWPCCSLSHWPFDFDMQRATQETCDLWDIWSEWWGKMTWDNFWQLWQFLIFFSMSFTIFDNFWQFLIPTF